MASILGIDTIQHQSGTTAMTIDSIGRTTYPARPSFIAHNNSTGNVTVSSSNPFPFNTTILNVGGHYNTSTYKFTCPIDGLYYFCFQVFGNTGSGTSNAGKSVQIRVNDSNSSPTIFSRCPDFTQDEYYFNASILNLSANDTVHIHSGDGWTNLYSDNSINYSRFMGYLIG